MQKQPTIIQSRSILNTNSVLRKTYMLLACTLIFSGITAGMALIMHVPPVNPILLIIGYFALLFATTSLRNHPLGIVAVFGFTGFLGYTLGSILQIYLAIPNGNQIIMTALAGTGIIFFGLSAYTLTSRKDFSYLGGFLMAGILIAVLASIATIFFNMPMLNLIVSAMFALLSSGIILYQTSQIIHGGETNYIMATITLYVALFNLFLSLLRILTAFSNRNHKTLFIY